MKEIIIFSEVVITIIILFAIVSIAFIPFNLIGIFLKNFSFSYSYGISLINKKILEILSQ